MVVARPDVVDGVQGEVRDALPDRPGAIFRTITICPFKSRKICKNSIHDGVKIGKNKNIAYFC